MAEHHSDLKQREPGCMPVGDAWSVEPLNKRCDLEIEIRSTKQFSNVFREIILPPPQQLKHPIFRWGLGVSESIPVSRGEQGSY